MAVWGVEMNLNPSTPEISGLCRNGFCEGRDEGRDRVRHVHTDGDTNILIRRFCLSRANAIVH